LQELAVVEWFAHEFSYAQIGREPSKLCLGNRRQDENLFGRAIVAFGDLLEHLDARSLREHQIENDDVGTDARDLLERSFAVGGRRNGPAFTLEEDCEETPNAGIVINDENADAFVCGHRRELPREVEFTRGNARRP